MKKKLNCVLLVDDSEADNFLHKKVLEKAGIAEHIGIAMDGQEALDMISGKGRDGKPCDTCPKPDLVFLDINMPVMDGWEFLEEYRKMDASLKGRVVIMMLSTSINPVDKSKAENVLGSDCFLYKPLTADMLDQVIREHFPEYI
jgi:CheY-like chemotaxis protein